MLFQVIGILFQIYFFMLLARILSSWMPELQNNPIVRFIAFYTDPYLNIFRMIIPPIGGIDLSPIAAMFALGFIEYGLTYLILFAMT